MTIPKQLAFDKAEYQRRWWAVRSGLEAAGVDLVVTFSPHNVNYLTGMDSENLFDFQCAILTATGEEPALVIFDFELARAENTAAVADIRTYGPFDDPIDFVVRQLESFHGARRIALDQTWIPVGRFEALRAALSRHDVSDGAGLVEAVRLVKSPAELTLIEQAARLTDIGVAAGLGAIGEHVEDREVAAAIVDAMYRAGSDTLCWGPVVAAGYRAGSAHSTFNGHRIAKGETIFLELTGEVSRYVSPLMRTAVAGEASMAMRAVEAAVTAALDEIVRSAAAGAAASEVARRGLAALEDVLPDHIFHHYFGYPVGIGYPPSWIESLGYFIRADNDHPLEEGMVFHLPISVRRYGEYGVNLSHTIVVESNGARTLGESPARLVSV